MEAVSPRKPGHQQGCLWAGDRAPFCQIAPHARRVPGTPSTAVPSVSPGTSEVPGTEQTLGKYSPNACEQKHPSETGSLTSIQSASERLPGAGVFGLQGNEVAQLSQIGAYRIASSSFHEEGEAKVLKFIWEFTSTAARGLGFWFTGKTWSLKTLKNQSSEGTRGASESA